MCPVGSFLPPLATETRPVGCLPLAEAAATAEVGDEGSKSAAQSRMFSNVLVSRRRSQKL